MLLPIQTVEKVWGREDLPPPFATDAHQPGSKPIGEIWFEPPPQMPELLVKYLLTSDKLSVQCHPNGEQAKAAGLGRKGKEECWLVIAADPGAMVGIGFDEKIDADALRAAALDGSVEDKLTWFEVQAGDFFYIPANTVHAIGPGCSIIEVQQNSNITYRLSDYGRPRELHLEAGRAVADGSPYGRALHQCLPQAGSATLLDGPFFRLDWVDGLPDDGLLYSYAAPLLVLPLAGDVLVSGEEVVKPGECALAPDLASVTFAPEGKALVTAPC